MKQTHAVTASLVVSLSALLACGAAPEGAGEPTSADLGGSEQALILGNATLSTSSKGALFKPPGGIIVKQPPIIYLPPPTADLVLDGVMRYYGGGTPTLGLQINVTNIGDSPATGPGGTVSINGTALTGALYQYNGGRRRFPTP
ncbi:MAG TPA: hypothetical protein VJV79_03830 [Polyangiaceae bacterium]|nr:hypothetical protein [Polyangiaceae bacterium]